MTRARHAREATAFVLVLEPELAVAVLTARRRWGRIASQAVEVGAFTRATDLDPLDGEGERLGVSNSLLSPPEVAAVASRGVLVGEVAELVARAAVAGRAIAVVHDPVTVDTLAYTLLPVEPIVVVGGAAPPEPGLPPRIRTLLRDVEAAASWRFETVDGRACLTIVCRASGARSVRFLTEDEAALLHDMLDA